MSDNNLIHLVYVSAAVTPFTEDMLLDLLQISQRNNIKSSITGLLLYQEGNFMQVLEGPATQVKALEEKISHDPRHRGVITLLEEEITTRTFEEWSMGFYHIRALEPHTPGYSAFLTDPLISETYREAPSKAMKLLLSFKEMIR